MSIKWMSKKSDYNEIRKSVNKDADNKKLEALKKEVIEILKKKENQEFKKAIEYIESQESRYSYLEKSDNGKWIEKAGYGIGTVRIWKGKKYKKVSSSPVKWVRVYDKEDRGAKLSMTRLIHKVEACENAEQLYQFCLSHHALFKDENGVDLPIMDKLRAAIDEQKGKVGDELDGSKHFQYKDKNSENKSDKKNSADKNYIASASDEKLKKQVTDAISKYHVTGQNLMNVLYNKDKDLYNKLDKMGVSNAEQFIMQVNADNRDKKPTEKKESEAEKHQNRSDAMKGNKNAWKGGKKTENLIDFVKQQTLSTRDGSYLDLSKYIDDEESTKKYLDVRVQNMPKNEQQKLKEIATKNPDMFTISDNGGLGMALVYGKDIDKVGESRSEAMKGNKNAYKGGPKDEPKDYSHMSQTELEKINKESFEKTKQGDDEASEIHNQIRHQMDLNERKVLHKKHMKYEETLEGKAAYLDEMISYAAKNIDSTNKQLTKLEGKKDGKSLMKHNKLVDYLHENQAEFEALTQLKNDLYDDWDKMQKEIADNYKGKMKSKEGKKWESAIENANSITELQNIKFDNEYDSFYDKNPDVSDEESNNLDADYQETTKMFNEKMDALIDKGKNDYAAKLINANLELKDLENILARVKANDTGMIGDNEDLPKKERIAILDSLIETEKNLIKEREEKIANAGDYTKLKVENKNNFTGEKQGIAAAVVDTDGKKITIPGNKNLAKELDQMMEVAEIGKIRSDNRLNYNYIGVSNGYLVATNGRSLKRIKVDGLPADLEGAYDIKIDGDNAVLTKKNYDMTIPKYDRVFPSNNNSNFELDNKATIAAIKELKKINYFKETHDKMKITINKNGAFIGSKKIGSGFNGEEREIYVNPNLLIPTLTNSAKSNISFDNDGVEDNKIIRALGISTNIGDSLLMPINGGNGDDVPNPDSYAKEHGERNEKLKNSIMESFNTDLQQERMNGVSDELKKKATNFMSSLDTKKGYEAKNEMITALPLIQRLLTEDRFKDMGLKPEFGRIEDSKYVLFRDKNGDSFRVSQFDTPSIAKFFKQLVADGEFGNVRKSLMDDEYFEKSFIYEQPSMFSTYETVKNIMDSLHRNR